MENVQLRLMDRISNLPENAMETILMHLTTRDAVRTSILSRKWRHVVVKLPQFVLDETLWKNVAKEQDSAKTTLMKVLYQLLLGHDGPIYKFTLSYPELNSCPEIDNLITFLRKRHIEDFSLEMWGYPDCYVLPLSIFSCQTLRYLKLRACSVLSSASIGFKRLTSIKLIEVIITAETLASLISGSPLLAILDIENDCEAGVIDVLIDAPNLKTLSIVGYNNFDGVVTNFCEFFDSLLALETLQLDFNLLRDIEVDIPKRLPTSLLHLKDLKLHSFSFNEMPELLFTLCLLRSSSNLKYIEITIQEYGDYYNQDWISEEEEEATSYMEREDYSDMCLNELREVTLLDVTGTAPELEFIKLLLAKSSSLKKIRVQPHKSVADKGFEILKEVTKFRRISNEAELIFSNS